VADHTAANEKLKALAASKNIDLPTGPSMTQMASKKRLQMKSEDSFDNAYIKDMINDHQEDIREFQLEAISGKDADARAFATATLPTLQSHLDKINQMLRPPASSKHKTTIAAHSPAR
jgi:putative membrane protein